MIKKYLFGMMLCALAGCQTQTAEYVDVDKELDYCAGQVTKALEARHEADGGYPANPYWKASGLSHVLLYLRQYVGDI